MLDCASNQPCEITLVMLEEVASPKESVTLLSKPTSKSNFAPRKYFHSPEQIAKELMIDEEGKLWWKQRKGTSRKMNKPAGSPGKNGYEGIRLDHELYYSHTLAWCLYYGCWPSSGLVIDHINHNICDNRKENLRLVSNAANTRNRKGPQTNNMYGVLGVCWNKAKNKWLVQLGLNGKNIYGGIYSKFEAAVAARRQLEIDYGVADYAVVTACTSPKSKTLDSISVFQHFNR